MITTRIALDAGHHLHHFEQVSAGGLLREKNEVVLLQVSR
jgi:hypothetical protein